MTECQQPGDIGDHIGMLISAAESFGHPMAGASEHASVKECETLLKAEIDAAETRAYAEGRKDEREEATARERDIREACVELREMMGNPVISGTMDQTLHGQTVRIAIKELCALLPGPYYMDPPDGGSVTVLEQLQRMAEDAAKWREQHARIALAIECEKRCEG